METNNKPLVSVIMPCYNDGAYINESIESLKKQTYDNIELIVIDDGSDDKLTLDRLRNIDFPTHKLLHTNHVRPARARNEGITCCRGKYILPLDSDDIIEPEYIELAVAEMEKSPNVGIVYCHADFFGKQRGPWELPDFSMEAFLADNCIFATSLFRKADWEVVGGFCADYVHGMEDYDFWLSIVALGREVVQLPRILFHYRIKKTSRSTLFNGDTEHINETYKLLYSRHRDFYAEHMDEYCLALRGALIDRTQTIRRYARIFAIPIRCKNFLLRIFKK